MDEFSKGACISNCVAQSFKFIDEILKFDVSKFESAASCSQGKHRLAVKNYSEIIQKLCNSRAWKLEERLEFQKFLRFSADAI